jgi:ABC-type transport system involved in multi-copper enzyme maturation permease subunit
MTVIDREAAPVETKRLSPYRSLIQWIEFLNEDNPMVSEYRRVLRRFLRSGVLAVATSIIVFLVYYINNIVGAYRDMSDGSLAFCNLELKLMTIALPALMYGAISGEREHDTWDALTLTRLTASQIVFGKLKWRFYVYLLIVVLTNIPILIIHYHILDPVPLDVLLQTQTVLLTWGVLVSAYTLWVSTMTKRSITTLIVVAGSLFGLLYLLPTLYDIIWISLGLQSRGFGGFEDPFNLTMMTFNPFFSLPDLISTGENGIPLLKYGTSGLPQIAVYVSLSVIFFRLTTTRIVRLVGPSRN